MSAATKTDTNRRKHYRALIAKAVGRRKLDAATDWIRARYRNADDKTIQTVVNELTALAEKEDRP